MKTTILATMLYKSCVNKKVTYNVVRGRKNEGDISTYFVSVISVDNGRVCKIDPVIETPDMEASSAKFHECCELLSEEHGGR